MTDIIERLKEPEAHYPGNFDTPKRANAMLSCLCQEAMEEIESLRRELTEKDALISRLQFALADTEALELGTAARLAAAESREQQLREGIEAIQDYAQEAIDRRVYEYGEDFRPLQLKAMRDDLAKAQKAIALPQDTTALESMIAKAGEVMRERTHSAMLDLKPWDHRGEIIRAIPAVTIDDLKC